MKAFNGNVVAQYGLVLALLVLFGVGAAGFLGSTFNNNMMQTGQATKTGSEELLSLLDTNPATGDAPPAMPGTNVSEAYNSLPTGFSGGGVVLEPNGMLTMPETFGTGAITTSAQGIKLFAAQLQALADGGALADGATQPSDSFRLLAGKANNVASFLMEQQVAVDQGQDPLSGITYMETVNAFMSQFNSLPAEDRAFIAEHLANEMAMVRSSSIKAGRYLEQFDDYGTTFSAYANTLVPFNGLSNDEVSGSLQLNIAQSIIEENADTIADSGNP